MSANCSDFLESVKRIGKRIQGALPIVGLLSRLASPEGGFDEVVSAPPLQVLTTTSNARAFGMSLDTLLQNAGQQAAASVCELVHADAQDN